MVDVLFFKDLRIIVIGNFINRFLIGYILLSLILKISLIWDFNFVYIENKILIFFFIVYKN